MLKVETLSNCGDEELRVAVNRGWRSKEIAYRSDCSLHFAHAAWQKGVVAVFIDGGYCSQILRREWLDKWIRYALDSLPYDVPRETQLDVHAMVQQSLSGLESSQPNAITERLVDAAIDKALRPWRQQKDIQRAIQAATDKLPFELRYSAEFAPLKQRAWEAAVAAVAKIRGAAVYSEMVSVAAQAVQPMIREHEHLEACQRMLIWIHVPDATWEKQDEAKEAVKRALEALPVGATQK